MRMLRVSSCACLIGCLALSLDANIDKIKPSDLTVILDFRGPHSLTSVKEMQRESGLILNATGVRLAWKMRGEDPSASYNDLVVMTFKGACSFQSVPMPPPPRYDELGPYAITHTTDGEVQPFGEVDCDRVVYSARAAMSGADYARADLLVGRAMGRVVAHELVHMLTKSGEHSHDGVQRASLSGRQLIASYLPLSALDVHRLVQERKKQ
jgi:hypothetical protein